MMHTIIRLSSNVTPPYRDLIKALACMWQVVNDLDLDFEQLHDVGV